MENKNLVHKGEGMDVIYHIENGIIEESYKGYCEDEEIKQSKQSFIDCVDKNSIKLFICDMRKFQGASPEIQQWVSEKWLPIIQEKGIGKLAMVLPEDFFGVFSFENVLPSVYIPAEKFMDYEEATKWILS